MDTQMCPVIITNNNSLPPKAVSLAHFFGKPKIAWSLRPIIGRLSRRGMELSSCSTLVPNNQQVSTDESGTREGIGVLATELDGPDSKLKTLSVMSDLAVQPMLLKMLSIAIKPCFAAYSLLAGCVEDCEACKVSGLSGEDLLYMVALAK